MDSLRPVTRQSEGCAQCQAQGADWLGLLMCLTCGWVACSDDSPRHHALAHYEETDHPITADLAPEAGPPVVLRPRANSLSGPRPPDATAQVGTPLDRADRPVATAPPFCETGASPPDV